MITTGLIILVLSYTICQCFLWIFVYSKAVNTKNHKKTPKSTEPVSIIICANKIEASINENLHSILSQQYPHYELVIVNDGPDPDLQQILLGIEEKYANIRIINQNKTEPGKKAALVKGILAAKYDWLLLTDADCIPMSDQWITSMMASREEETKIVLGFSPYRRAKSMLNLLIRFEGLLTAIQYLSLTKMGYPYMAVGRNVLYRKSIFNVENLRMDIISGDDDLLINAQANSTNTRCCLDHESFVMTWPKESWNDYFFQKLRHYSVSKYYNPKSQIILIIHFSSFIGLWIGSIMLLSLGVIILPTICMLIYILISSSLFAKNAIRLRSADLSVHYVYLNIIYLVFIILQAPLIFFKRKSW